MPSNPVCSKFKLNNSYLKIKTIFQPESKYVLETMILIFIARTLFSKNINPYTFC